MPASDFNDLLQKTLTDNANKEYLFEKSLPGRQKQIKPSRHIELTVALNLALKNYQNIRSTCSEKKPLTLPNITQMLMRYMSNKFYKNIEQMEEETGSIPIQKINWELKAIKDFSQIEYTLFFTLKELRNYHSHHIHEPGINSFESYFDTSVSKKLNPEELKKAQKWFKQRFDDAKKHLLKSLHLKKESLASDPMEIQKIDAAIKSFNKIYFYQKDNKTLSQEGTLFVACLFLYKRQAHIIIQKYFKNKLQEYKAVIMTFFSYFSLKESYSVNNYHDDLLQFRTLVSLLTTLPVIDSPNKNVRELYQSVYQHNEDIKKTIQELNDEINTNGEKSQEVIQGRKETIKNLQKKLIPLRKRYVFTDLLLQFLLDQKCFPDSFEIAINKTPLDIVNYYENHSDELNSNENLSALKDRIKEETDLAKKERLRAHFKELKRNFVFKRPNDLKELLKPYEQPGKTDAEVDSIFKKEIQGFRFAIKKKNALIRYKGQNVTLSPQILQKWVFSILMDENSTQIKNKIINQIESFLAHFQVESIEDLKTKLSPVLSRKILPKSILNCVETPSEEALKKKTHENLKTRIEKLEHFKTLNIEHPTPHRYASKRKIDTILEYLHFCLLREVHLDENFKGDMESHLRHTYFGVEDYKKAYEYFRYFGRYKNNTIFQLQESGEEIVLPQDIGFLKTQYQKLFNFIKTEDKGSKKLEDIFTKVIEKYITQLKELQKESVKIKALARVLRVRGQSTIENINQILKSHYTKSFSIHPDTIEIKKCFEDKWNEYQDKFPHKTNASDFALMRYVLIKEDEVQTNADFIIKKFLSNNPEVKIPPSIYKKILQIKTEELLLWNMAKTYWLKAQEEPYVIENKQQETSIENYRDFNFFYRVYEKELDHKIEITTSFWNNNNIERFKEVLDQNKNLRNQDILFTIKIPARRYDNKFLGFEKQLIVDYMLWNHCKDNKIEILESYSIKNLQDHKRTLNLNKYDDLLVAIREELKSSWDDIFLILNSEKKNFTTEVANKQLTDKYQSNPIEDFYLDFANYLKVISEEEENIPTYLKMFRNFAMHFNLQDPIRRKEIEDFLFKDSDNKKLTTIQKS